MSELTRLPNIGNVVAAQLEAVGIHNLKDLKAAGSRTAWLRIQQQDPSACLMRLYGLEGAIQGVRWHSMPSTTKAELKDFYNTHKIKLKE